MIPTPRRTVRTCREIFITIKEAGVLSRLHDSHGSGRIYLMVNFIVRVGSSMNIWNCLHELEWRNHDEKINFDSNVRMCGN